MWMMTNKGMLSIVQHREHPNVLLVRARDRQTLEALLPDYEPLETPEADYRFRVLVPRSTVAELALQLVGGIDYDNFKNSVENQLLHDAYLDCWAAMYRYQAMACDHSDGRIGRRAYLDDGEVIAESYPPGWPIGALPIADEDAEVQVPTVKRANGSA